MLVKEITPREVAHQHSLGKVQLLDVREDSELAICRIDGALHMPLARLVGGEKIDLDPDLDIVCFCHHGVRSLYSAMYLLKNGFQKVFSMSGGINAWALEVDPSTPRY